MCAGNRAVYAVCAVSLFVTLGEPSPLLHCVLLRQIFQWLSIRGRDDWPPRDHEVAPHPPRGDALRRARRDRHSGVRVRFGLGRVHAPWNKNEVRFNSQTRISAHTHAAQDAGVSTEDKCRLEGAQGNQMDQDPDIGQPRAVVVCGRDDPWYSLGEPGFSAN